MKAEIRYILSIGDKSEPDEPITAEALPALIAFVGNRLERETHPEHEDAYEEMEAHHE